MRLTVRTLLALRTLVVCAEHPGRTLRKADVAAALQASENHLAQVVHRLGRAGLLATFRGRGGGFGLAQPADRISLGAVARAFEGEGARAAEGSDCPIQAEVRRATEAFYAALDPVSLADVARRAHALDRAA